MKTNVNNRVLPVNKSEGASTYDCIRRFKRLVDIDKIGHAGTLDPPATGLILLLTGEATKLSNYIMDLPKRYRADIMLGESTDTQDASGEVVEKGVWTHVTRKNIESILANFLGPRMQVPPMYSALKHKGRPLYVLARQGRVIDRKPREVEVYEIKLVDCRLPVFTIEVYCSRGLYLRVLAEEIGSALAVPAHLSSLVRTHVGHFSLEEAVPDGALESFLTMHEPGFSLANALSHLPGVNLSAEQARGLRHGVAPRAVAALPGSGELVRLLDPDGCLGGIAEVGAAGVLQIRRVFTEHC
jgi:tRNA pseudouridine55 synthase